MMSSIFVVFMLCLAFLLRILPYRLCPSGLGVDHWFWKAYVETYRRERQFPPVLPQYLLDENQWYPPLFPLLIAHTPAIIFDRYSHWVAIAIDLLRMVLLLVAVNWLSGGSSIAIGIAGLVYATTPILISYNIQLNPRGLGALFLDGLILLFLWWYFFNGPPWILGTVLTLAGLILLTHKMTTQLFWFLCLGGALLSMNWWLIALIPASILMALLMSKGFYWNVLRAHWDIVGFWYRNWKWLQAHPIKESPIYGVAGHESPAKFHKPGWKGILKHLGYLMGYNPQVWMLCTLITVRVLLVSDSYSWAFHWVILTLFFSLVTVFVPSLKCLGSGYFYLYNAALPTSLLWGLMVSTGFPNIFLSIGFLLAVALGLLSIIIFFRRLTFFKVQKTDKNFEDVLDYLKNKQKGTVMCLPPQWYDVVAYKTGQPVLYGGHGYGLKLLEPLFPRLMVPMPEIIKQYQVRYLVTLEGYLPANFLVDLDYESLLDFGQYSVYHLVK